MNSRCQDVRDGAGSALPWPKAENCRAEDPHTRTGKIRPVIILVSNWITTHSFFSLLCSRLREKGTCKVESHHHLFPEKTAERREGRMRKLQLWDTKHTKTNAHYSAQPSTTFLTTHITWIHFLKGNRQPQQQPDGLSNLLHNYSPNYLDLIIQEGSHCHW